MAILLLAALGCSPAIAQTIVVVRGVPALAHGAISAADYDGDGDQDLVVLGQKLNGTPVTGVYRSNGIVSEPNRTVADHRLFAFPARRFKSGDVVWADVDGDGDSDLLMTGAAIDDIDFTQVIEEPATDFFENDGQTFWIRDTPSLPPLSESTAAWADIDGDGDLDLALAGRDVAGNAFLGIFRHDGSFGFQPLATTWEQPLASDMAWGDYDGDGDPDLIVAGLVSANPVTLMLENVDGGGFAVKESGLPGLYFAAVSAGDFDGDGDDDIALSGGVIGPSLVVGVADVYRSDSGAFTAVDSGMGAVIAGDVSWGDFDADGDLDLMVAGIQDLNSLENQRITVYEQRDGGFHPAYSLRGVLFGSTVWYDSTGNGRLDILMSGIQENRLIISIFEL